MLVSMRRGTPLRTPPMREFSVWGLNGRFRVKNQGVRLNAWDLGSIRFRDWGLGWKRFQLSPRPRVTHLPLTPAKRSASNMEFRH